MIDFPASPTNGQQFISGGTAWTWDGAKWVASGNAVMPPLSTGDNRLINGDMRIDARNNGAALSTINVFTVDRWQYAASVNKGTWGRNIGAIASAPGFPNYLGFSGSAVYAPAASEVFVLQQPIEADAVSDFQWGTAAAQPVTLSFWAYSSLTGTFGGSIRNYATTRSYPFSYSLPAALTWTKIVITIPGDTAGTWVMSGNGGALWLGFDLGSASNMRGAAGAWNGFGLLGVTGAVSLLTPTSGYLFLTGVKLEIGSVATPYNRQSLTKSQADCQRYFYSTGGISLNWTVNALNGAYFFTQFFLPTTMRVAPTIAMANSGVANMGTAGWQNTTSDRSEFFAVATATAIMSINFTFLTFSAEL